MAKGKKGKKGKKKKIKVKRRRKPGENLLKAVVLQPLKDLFTERIFNINFLLKVAALICCDFQLRFLNINHNIDALLPISYELTFLAAGGYWVIFFVLICIYIMSQSHILMEVLFLYIGYIFTLLSCLLLYGGFFFTVPPMRSKYTIFVAYLQTLNVILLRFDYCLQYRKYLRIKLEEGEEEEEFVFEDEEEEPEA